MIGSKNYMIQNTMIQNDMIQKLYNLKVLPFLISYNSKHLSVLNFKIRTDLHC